MYITWHLCFGKGKQLGSDNLWDGVVNLHGLIRKGLSGKGTYKMSNKK